MTSPAVFFVLITGICFLAQDTEKPALANLKKGMESYQQKKFTQALEYLDEAIQLDSKNAQAFYYRGLVHRMRISEEKNQEKALADFNEAIRLNPKYAEAYKSRGWLKHSKDKDSAEKDLTKSLQLNTKDDEAYWMIGCVYYDLKKYSKAKESWQEAVRKNEKSALGHMSLATIQACCPDGKYRDGTEAVKNATKAADLTDWQFPAAIDTLAMAHAECGQFEAAIKWEKRALEVANGGLATPLEVLVFEEHLKKFEKHEPVRVITAIGGK